MTQSELDEATIKELRRLGDLKKAIAETQKYATRLAEALHKKHYVQTAPDWKPLPDLYGLLTQIDNMTADLALPAQPVGPVVEVLSEEICAAYHDFEGSPDLQKQYPEGGWPYVASRALSLFLRIVEGEQALIKQDGTGFPYHRIEALDRLATRLREGEGPGDGWRDIESAAQRLVDDFYTKNGALHDNVADLKRALEKI